MSFHFYGFRTWTYDVEASLGFEVVAWSRHKLSWLWRIVYESFPLGPLSWWEDFATSSIDAVDLCAEERLLWLIATTVRIIRLFYLMFIGIFSLFVHFHGQSPTLCQFVRSLAIVFCEWGLTTQILCFKYRRLSFRCRVQRATNPTFSKLVRRRVRAKWRNSLTLLRFHYLLGNYYARTFVMEWVLLGDSVDSLGVKVITPILDRKFAVWHCFFIYGTYPLIHVSFLTSRRQFIGLPVQNIDVLSGILFRQFWNLVARNGVL